MKYLKTGGIGAVKSPHYSQMGPWTGLKPIGNVRELKNKHPERVRRAPGDQILSMKFKRPFGPVGLAALGQPRPRQFWIFGGTLEHLVDPGIYLIYSYIIFIFQITLKMIVALISVLQIWKLDGSPRPPCHIFYPNLGSALTFCKPYWACLNKLDLNDC